MSTCTTLPAVFVVYGKIVIAYGSEKEQIPDYRRRDTRSVRNAFRERFAPRLPQNRRVYQIRSLDRVLAFLFIIIIVFFLFFTKMG